RTVPDGLPAAELSAMQNTLPDALVAWRTTVEAVRPVMPTRPTVVPALSHVSEGSTPSAVVQESAAAPHAVLNPVYTSASVKNVFAAASPFRRSDCAARS